MPIREVVNNAVMLVLTEVDLSERELKEMPEDLVMALKRDLLGQLETLKLQNNGLSSVADEVGRLEHLQVLLLEFNQLKETLNPALSGCRSLTLLDASHNQLTGIPEVLAEAWGRLSRLVLHHNLLSSLPSRLGQLSALTELDLHSNRLERLPGSLGQLSGLRILMADHNLITELPESVGMLSNLTFLSLNQNKLKSLPAELEGCKSLATVQLAANPRLSVLTLALSKLHRAGVLKTCTVDSEVVMAPEWRANVPDIVDFLRFAGHYKIAVNAKAHWQPNDTTDKCGQCRAQFSWMLRRHHCRVCGLVLCWECTDNAMMIEVLDSWSPSRVCGPCFKLIKASRGGVEASTKTPAASSSFTPTSSASNHSSNSMKSNNNIDNTSKPTTSSSTTTTTTTTTTTRTPDPSSSGAEGAAQFLLTADDRQSLSQDELKAKIEDTLQKIQLQVERKRRDAGNLRKLVGFYKNDPEGRSKVEEQLRQLEAEMDGLSNTADDLAFELTTLMVTMSPSHPSGSQTPSRHPGSSRPTSASELSSSTDSPSAKFIGRCRALYSYPKSDDGTLVFNEGDVMDIFNDDDPNWFFVALGDREGYVPSSWVQMI